jgi:hypothetical protein
VLYSDFEADRDLQHRTLLRVAEHFGVSYDAAISKLHEGMLNVSVRTPPHQIHIEDVLGAAGVPFRISAMQGEQETALSAAERAAVTPAPDPARVDAHGRVTLTTSDAAKLLTSEMARVEQALEAKANLLPGSEDLDEFAEQVKQMAAVGVDLTATLLNERRTAEIEREALRFALGATTSPPMNPYQETLASAQRHAGTPPPPADDVFLLMQRIGRSVTQAEGRTPGWDSDRRAGLKALNADVARTRGQWVSTAPRTLDAANRPAGPELLQLEREAEALIERARQLGLSAPVRRPA